MLPNQFKQISERLKVLKSKTIRSQEDEVEIKRLEKCLDNLFEDDWD